METIIEKRGELKEFKILSDRSFPGEDLLVLTSIPGRADPVRLRLPGTVGWRGVVLTTKEARALARALNEFADQLENQEEETE